jgi:leucyl/phenylalanyl-tRNA--protein transferase
MVLVASEIQVGRSLAKTVRRGAYEVRLDTAFRDVVEACSAVPRRGQSGTWITPEMIDAYVELHRRGVAHSAEAWQGGELAGGLYGVSLGGAFFGESMFARAPDASKVAFVTLVRKLVAWGIDLVDCQVHTDHLARFGATEWPRPRFLAALAAALEKPTRLGPWRLSDEGADPSPPVPVVT